MDPLRHPRWACARYVFSRNPHSRSSPSLDPAGSKLEAATHFQQFYWVAASSRLPFIGMGMAFLRAIAYSANRFAKALPLSFSALMIWFVITVLFQTPSVSSESSDFKDRLQTAVEQAQCELEAEKARIQKELQAREDELQQVRAECKTLSDEVVERKIAIARKQGALRGIRKQRETLWTERTQFQEDLAQVKAICRDVETELNELLDIMPVSEHRPSQDSNWLSSRNPLTGMRSMGWFRRYSSLSSCF